MSYSAVISARFSLQCFDLSVAKLSPAVLEFKNHNTVLLSVFCFERNICLSGLLYELADGDSTALDPKRVVVLCVCLRLRKSQQSTYKVSKAVVVVIVLFGSTKGAAVTCLTIYGNKEVRSGP